MSYLFDYFCCGNEYICDLSQDNIKYSWCGCDFLFLGDLTRTL